MLAYITSPNDESFAKSPIGMLLYGLEEEMEAFARASALLTPACLNILYLGLSASPSGSATLA